MLTEAKSTMKNSCFNAGEAAVIANGFAVAFSKELSIDEQNIWGNIFALVGASLLTLAAINQTAQEQSGTSNSSGTNSTDTTKKDTSSKDTTTGDNSKTGTSSTDSGSSDTTGSETNSADDTIHTIKY
jgi:hypothetical protein